MHSGCKNIGTSLFIGKVLLVVPQVLAKCKLLSFLGQGLLAAQSRDATRHHVGSLDDGDGDEAEKVLLDRRTFCSPRTWPTICNQADARSRGTAGQATVFPLLRVKAPSSHCFVFICMLSPSLQTSPVARLCRISQNSSLSNSLSKRRTSCTSWSRWTGRPQVP